MSVHIHPQRSVFHLFLNTIIGFVVLATGLFALSSGTAAAGSSADLVLYHIQGTRSERVVWLMKELDLPFKFAADPKDTRASFMAMVKAHPMRMAPTIVDDGTAMVESGAILQYIIHKYGNDRLAADPSSEDYQQYLLWMHYAEGSAATRMMADYWAHEVPNVKEVAKVLSGQLGGAERVLNFTELTLAQQPYFGGKNFTAADIMMHFPLKLARMWGVDMSLFPKTQKWMSTVEARPGFKKMLDVGTPDGDKPTPGRFQPLLEGTGKK